jgi:4-amino-4-deoxy-L-arabinose transferase-like glycosyltransferase
MTIQKNNSVVEHQSIHLAKDNREPLDRSDIWAMLALCLGTLIYTTPYLGAFEFLRHTEADRALIAWEMLQTGDLLIPRLYGEPYLTKPPLYYWLLTAVFSVSGIVAENTARLVSAISLSCISPLLYFFLRSSGSTKLFSVLCALLFLTFGHIYDYSLKAEMDVCYTLFTSLAVMLGYLICQSPSRGLVLLCIAATTAAAMIKGPPVFIFYGFGVFGLLVLKSRKLPKPIPVILRSSVPHLIVLAAAAVLASIWWLLVAQRLGFDFIAYHFQEELVHRFTGESVITDRKPWHYYLSHAPGALLPWSLLLLGLFRRTVREDVKSAMNRRSSADLIVFSCCVIVPSICLLSLSGGKSNRYLMPLYPFIAILLTYLGSSIELTWQRFSLRKCVIAIASLMFISRVPVALLYAPWKNARDSSSAVIQEIAQHAAGQKKVYILEAFERWVPFYLLKANVAVERLSPAVVAQLKGVSDEKKLLLLLNVEDEDWRLGQIAPFDNSLQVVSELKTRKHRWKLLSVQANQTWRFAPKERIPTRPSTPYPAAEMQRKSSNL